MPVLGEGLEIELKKYSHSFLKAKRQSTRDLNQHLWVTGPGSNYGIERRQTAEAWPTQVKGTCPPTQSKPRRQPSLPQRFKGGIHPSKTSSTESQAPSDSSCSRAFRKSARMTAPRDEAFKRLQIISICSARTGSTLNAT